MSIDLYEDIIDLWDDQAEEILTDSITAVDVQGGLPAFLLQQPLRWGGSEDLVMIEGRQVRGVLHER